MTAPACSFCGAGPAEVAHLVSGPGVWICDGCVRASYEIIESLAHEENPAVPVADPVLATIAQVQQLALSGEREQAKAAYEQLWPRVEHGRPLHRLSVAHYLADLQDDPAAELRWDERALAAAAEVGPHHEDAAAVAPLRASLHVNTAAALAKAGRGDEARHRLAAARLAEADLPDDGYGRLVRGRIDSVAAELDGQQSLL
ncbi:ClpX C4-type zinc finger protein [Amycolatopsis rhabdoformis]|uniref:ClpX C4-type zinc finger protein n=1 Tax=Amycolatopsis rhabdoformis TaxID=1448059 RepID=A0ABZ1IDB4_9PSEU|nr:ClpX C4-type zinc finger protein [Amycolatopsis rhabdoformis]WSE31907.1 ClpX C4-type zinc finger protein [Amycolatopsis rhabdoformis]